MRVVDLSAQRNYRIWRAEFNHHVLFEIVAEDNKDGKTEGPVWKFITTSCPVVGEIR
jgi:hypothetical protein